MHLAFIVVVFLVLYLCFKIVRAVGRRLFSGAAGTSRGTRLRTNNMMDPANPNSPLNPMNPQNPASPRNRMNPANPNSPLNPMNPQNPNSPLNPANPNSPINQANRRRR